ncbi:MAG: TRAP transporter small permease subunit [Gammaproteobacteria bacterium]|jgi:TRAP-type mannitol/chloroaromatic compound transport system permease small subunit|nr:MAG: TRAP transporter small permease subunit [Gammaproteobacteria bacterium]
MALITFAIVLFRYGLNLGAIAVQESVLYLHAIAFMLGIPYALKTDEHVRVDVVYSRLSTRPRAWVNLLGHCLFLLPVAASLLWLSLPYVGASWRVLEGSPEVGGIPGVFLLKTLIPVTSALLFLQGLAGIGRAVRAIRSQDGPSAGSEAST